LLIFPALKLKLTLMRCLIYLLLATVHHFRIGERSELVRLFGFGQTFLSGLKEKGLTLSLRVRNRAKGESILYIRPF
jgi:hypothetical protein